MALSPMEARLRMQGERVNVGRALQKAQSQVARNRRKKGGRAGLFGGIGGTIAGIGAGLLTGGMSPLVAAAVKGVGTGLGKKIGADYGARSVKDRNIDADVMSALGRGSKAMRFDRGQVSSLTEQRDEENKMLRDSINQGAILGGVKSGAGSLLKDLGGITKDRLTADPTSGNMTSREDIGALFRKPVSAEQLAGFPATPEVSELPMDLDPARRLSLGGESPENTFYGSNVNDSVLSRNLTLNKDGVKMSDFQEGNFGAGMLGEGNSGLSRRLDSPGADSLNLNAPSPTGFLRQNNMESFSPERVIPFEGDPNQISKIDDLSAVFGNKSSLVEGTGLTSQIVPVPQVEMPAYQSPGGILGLGLNAVAPSIFPNQTAENPAIDFSGVNTQNGNTIGITNSINQFLKNANPYKYEIGNFGDRGTMMKGGY
tara:strand:+ start:68 stop:1351 length:1284 start_codon:yes stop_codon:yes gene_type:complete